MSIQKVILKEIWNMWDAKMFFIIEKVKEALLDVLHRTVKVF